MKLIYLIPIAFALSACFPVEEKQEPIIVDEDIALLPASTLDSGAAHLG